MNDILLSILVFSPVLGILALCFVPGTNERAIKWTGIIATFPALLISLILYKYFLGGNDLSTFSEKVNWIRFGGLADMDSKLFTVDYELALDGFSLLMVLLTTVLSTLAAVASIHIKK